MDTQRSVLVRNAIVRDIEDRKIVLVDAAFPWLMKLLADMQTVYLEQPTNAAFFRDEIARASDAALEARVPVELATERQLAEELAAYDARVRRLDLVIGRARRVRPVKAVVPARRFAVVRGGRAQ
jgi:hypothetical protein